MSEEEAVDLKAEFNKLKEATDRFESYLKKHRKSAALFFILIIGLFTFYLVMNGSQSFNTIVNYASEDGSYNCTETYRFNKLITERCIPPWSKDPVDYEYFNK